MAANSVIRLKPYFYVHVVDNNSLVTRIEVGPQTFTRQEHEKVVFGPEEMIKIPPRHYLIIENPILKDENNKPVFDNFGNPRLRFSDYEIRFDLNPFPLYPGEVLSGKITPLQVVAPNTALRLRALRDFTIVENEKKTARQTSDEWLFPGPATYIPRVEVQVVEIIRSTVLLQNQALKLRARRATTDYKGNARRSGEEWLVREQGAYLPLVDEECVETVRGIILTSNKALHLRAARAFRDIYGIQRRSGEEWLVTIEKTDVHIPDVHEELVGEVKLTALNNRQYCIVLDPVGKDGKPQFGLRELRKGDVSFFLQPGEKLERSIQQVHVLAEEEALLLRAREAYKTDNKTYAPGERWMIHGPTDYVPPVEVEIVEKRRSIPLDENEGIYVRDIRTGKVTSICGRSYMLQPHEELWEKDLSKTVFDLLYKPANESSGSYDVTPASRDKTRVVTYRAPHNSAVQIYDYKTKRSRIVFGPELVMLGPDEQFTVLSLSGGKPKKSDAIRSVALLLGPDFMTDVVTVETSDHARLALQLSYNWHFLINREDSKDARRLFNVPDFVGDACKAIASRVRGSVASATFDNFHRYSAELIRVAVFGAEGTKDPNAKLTFEANTLCITGVDIQSVEPVDQRTRDSLQKAVQLAIEITTKSQEAAARHEAERLEQEARGRLQRQRIEDESKAEQARKDLLQLQANSAVVEVTGQATAEARARCDAAEIEAAAAVKQSELRAQATKIRAEAELEQTKRRQEAEVTHKKQLMDIELKQARELAEIEARKFAETVDAIGADTITAMARAGPEMQAKLLQGLGLNGFMITDGHSPINLFQTAQGLIQTPSI